MSPTLTRIVCAALSTVGAAGLVAFANPANAVGAAHHAARPAAITAAAVAAVSAPATRG